MRRRNCQAICNVLWATLAILLGTPRQSDPSGRAFSSKYLYPRSRNREKATTPPGIGSTSPKSFGVSVIACTGVRRVARTAGRSRGEQFSPRSSSSTIRAEDGNAKAPHRDRCGAFRMFCGRGSLQNRTGQLRSSCCGADSVEAGMSITRLRPPAERAAVLLRKINVGISRAAP